MSHEIKKIGGYFDFELCVNNFPGKGISLPFQEAF